MTSIPGSENLAWSDEQTRLYLQLRIEEKLKGNIRGQIVNETARQSIMHKFFETYGERHPWKKFGIKFTTCKKQYESFKKLTRNKTGLGYDESSEDWWNERCKEWPGARKIKDKPVANMDLMEQVFGTVHISGAEGWAPQQGEQHLDTMNLDQDNDADAESRQIPGTQDVDADAESRQIRMDPPTQVNGPSSSNVGNGRSSSSRAKASKKRSRSKQAGQDVAEVIRESVQSRDKILSHKNQLIENHPEFSCSLHTFVLGESQDKSHFPHRADQRREGGVFENYGHASSFLAFGLIRYI